MGDPEGWPQPSGLLPEGCSALFPSLDDERWLRAEERTLELITRIQPTKSSEERRRAVSEYVQRLIRKCIDCEVFTFGSVPLKTYLPDGDIDLTAFSRNPHWKDTWANEVRSALEAEEHSQEAEFRVKEVQYIQAEVKIIKCLVENIVVDISFNQLGGLCTLCFLEEVDRLIGRDHLFKRSILLVKAWCYYESRILGAHHGLISTYALETLVLYIFHVFHASLRGPLGVLFRFLEFFSNFDWDKYCVSLWGPVPLAGLPDMAVELPRKDGGKLLLTKVFLEQCARAYAVSPNINDVQSRAFSSKYLNVIDPLKVTNNLGRSVSKGNFFRIRSAFSYGARKLARILECQSMDSVVEELDKFFMNTWERHGSGKRPDAPDPIERLPSPASEGPVSDVESESPKREKTPKKKREQPSRLSGEIPVFAVEHGRMNDLVQKRSPSAAIAKSHQGELETELATTAAEPFMDREYFEARIYRDSGPPDEAYDVAADVRVPRESFQKLSLSPGAKLPPPSLWGNASPLDVPSFFPRAPAVPMNHVEEASAEAGTAEDMPPTPNLVAWDSMAKGSSPHVDHQHQVPVLAGPPPPPPTNLDPSAASVLHQRKGRPVENHSGPAYYYAGVPFYVPYSYPVYLLPPEAAGGDSFGDFLPLPTSEDGICGVGDRLSAAGIPVSAGQRVEAEPDARFDHLGSDFVSHLRNLEYGRTCQQPPFFMPVFPLGKEHHMWEGPGRLGMKQVGHGRGRGYHRSLGGFNADEAGKGRAGTGTYIPAGSNNRHRDRQYRGHHDVYQERNEYDASPRYPRYGRGSNRITQKTDKGWHDGGYNRSSMPPVAFSAAAATGNSAGGNVLSPPPPVNMDVYSQVYMNGNGNSAAPAAPLLVVYPYGAPNEALEFGTLGPMQGSGGGGGGGSSSSSSSRTSSDRQQHQHQHQQQQQVLLQHQQQHQLHQLQQLQQPVQGGTDLSHQSCVLPSFRPTPELAYQMKEEDFPPLSFRGPSGSGGSSPGGGGGGGSSKSSYQTYVASQS